MLSYAALCRQSAVRGPTLDALVGVPIRHVSREVLGHHVRVARSPHQDGNGVSIFRLYYQPSRLCRMRFRLPVIL